MTRRCAILVVTGLTATGCATPQSRPVSKGVAPMFDVLMNVIPRSDAIVFSTVVETERITVDGKAFVRTKTTVHETYKGLPARQRIVVIDIPEQGKETPQLDREMGFVFFLRSTHGRWLPVDLSTPLPVPAENRNVFLRCIQDYVKVAESKPDESATKTHALKMLETRIAFFQTDAARVALGVSAWEDDQIERLIGLINGDERHDRLRGNDKDNLAAIVIGKGKLEKVLPFARSQLKLGDSDSVYYGLVKRQGPTVDEMLLSLLRDADRPVQFGALRVAGLLRRREMIDEFEKRNAPRDDLEMRNAIATARGLASRE